MGIEKTGKHVSVFFYANDRGKMPLKELRLAKDRLKKFNKIK